MLCLGKVLNYEAEEFLLRMSDKEKENSNFCYRKRLESWNTFVFLLSMKILMDF